MFVLANTMERLLLLLVVAGFHRTIAEQFDPAIPCATSEACAGLSNTAKAASCRDGYCVCTYGEEVKNCSGANIVHQINRNTGDSIFQICKLDQDCKLNNTFCNTTITKCECKKDYVLWNAKKMCIKKEEALDFPCVADKDCSAFLSNMTCQNSVCACRSGYHHVQNACYKTIDIGERCNRTEECAHVKGAICTDRDVCSCAEFTVISEDRKRCLPVAQRMQAECVEDAQCDQTFQNALCIDRTCQCRYQYHYVPEVYRCFVDRKLGEDCATTYECYQPEQSMEDRNVTEKALKCVGNVCVCGNNYQWEEGRCVNEGSSISAAILPIFLATIIRAAFSRRN